MRKYILLSFMFLTYTLTSQAQSAGLTKTETIDYIQKRLNSAIGSIVEIKLGAYFKKRIEYITSATVKLYNSELQINYGDLVGYTNNLKATSPDDRYEYEYNTSYTFDLNKINQIFISGDTLYDSSPLLYLGIEFKENYVKCATSSREQKHYYDGSCCYWSSWSGQSYNSYKNAFFPIQRGDFEKCKKAILYLRDLIKAEDPFGN